MRRRRIVPDRLHFVMREADGSAAGLISQFSKFDPWSRNIVGRAPARSEDSKSLQGRGGTFPACHADDADGRQADCKPVAREGEIVRFDPSARHAPVAERSNARSCNLRQPHVRIVPGAPCPRSIGGDAAVL